MIISAMINNKQEIFIFSLKKNEERTGYCDIISMIYYIKDLVKLSNRIKNNLIPKNKVGLGVPLQDFCTELSDISEKDIHKQSNFIITSSINSNKWNSNATLVEPFLYLWKIHSNKA